MQHQSNDESFLSLDVNTFENVLSFLSEKDIHNLFTLSKTIATKYAQSFGKHIYFHGLYKWFNPKHITRATVFETNNINEFTLLKTIADAKRYCSEIEISKRTKEEFGSLLRDIESLKQDDLRRLYNIKLTVNNSYPRLTHLIIKGNHIGRHIPLGIEHLYITGNTYISPVVYPHLKTFYCKGHYAGPPYVNGRQMNTKLENLCLKTCLNQEEIPENLNHLELSSFSGKKLVLPQNLISLRVNNMRFNVDMEFPSCIKVIIIDSYDGGEIKIPDTCEVFEIRSGRILSNQLILPPSLKRLVLDCKFNFHIYPAFGLKELIIGEKFDMAISLPTSLEIARFGHCFNKSLKLPYFLRELQVGSKFRASIIFNSNLKVLRMLCEYGRQLELPNGLKEFTFYQKNNILASVPDSLEVMTVSTKYDCSQLPVGNFKLNYF